MLATLSEQDLRDWNLFDEVEPIGPRETRDQLAMLLAKLHNRWRPKGAEVLSAKDFQLQPPIDPVEVEQQKKRGMIDTLRLLARPASERPRHRKHSRELKRPAREAKRKRPK